MSTAFGILLCQQETLYSCCLSFREGEGLGEHTYAICRVIERTFNLFYSILVAILH